MKKKSLIFISTLCLHCNVFYQKCANNKILHLTFHRGCVNEIEFIGKHYNLNLTTWFIPELKPYFFDPKSKGSSLYNVDHARAKRIWDKHKNFFNSFDTIITSDTAPLSRIFLQNKFSKKLVIWICNRFDYADIASLDCVFPDKEYYSLFRSTNNKKNTTVIGYTPIEFTYTNLKNVKLKNNTILKPSGLTNIKVNFKSSIPTNIKRNETFFIPPYHNDTVLHLQEKCHKLDIKSYHGRYNGPWDLKKFKGIIHIPYSWSNLALFENWQQGIVYFIPSPTFFKQLSKVSKFFFPNKNLLDRYLTLTEWYNPLHKDLFVYFDSWKDLKIKIDNTNYEEKKTVILQFAQNHAKSMLKKWEKLINA